MKELEEDSSRTTRELARDLDIPQSTVISKIKKLKRLKILLGDVSILDYKKLGKELTVFIHVVVTARALAEKIAQKIAKHHWTREVHIVSGQYDIIAKVNLDDTKALYDFIFGKDGLRIEEGIERTESMIVMKTTKENGLRVQS